jgi:hypothetical protein
MKLTLSIDPKVTAAAKKYAQKKGVSLSKLVEEYFPKKSKDALKGIHGAMGSMPSDSDYKKEIGNYVLEKHLKR